MSYLKDLVVNKVRELGVKDGAQFFGVSELLATQWTAGSKPVSLSAVEKVFKEPEFSPRPSIEADWAGRKVAILLPWYRQTNPLTAFSIMGLLDRQKMAVLMAFGDAFIAHTRNKLATQFLDMGVEWSLWLDDDMVMPFGNANWFRACTGISVSDKFAGMHTINRLLSHNKTIIGGLYWGRRDGARAVFSEAASNQHVSDQVKKSGPVDAIRATRWVGTGCMLVHRKVYLDIEAKFPDLSRKASNGRGNWFSTSEADLKKEAKESLDILADVRIPEASRIQEVQKKLHAGYLRSRTNSGLGMGEDVVFCVRAASAGHQPFVDLGLLCGHMGNKIYSHKS